MDLNWQNNAEITVKLVQGDVVLSANRAGLRSLAEHLLTLADEAPGCHIHYDSYNALEEGSAGLIVELVE